MLPLNLSFRQMMKKYIPQISSGKLNDYENLLGLRHRLYQEQSIANHIQKKYPPGRKIKQGDGMEIERAQSYRQALMSSLTSEVDEIFKNHDKAFAAAVQLWIARRQFALEQGYLLQIPTSIESLRRYIRAYKNYRKVQIKTLPTLWCSKAINFVQNLTVGKIIIYGLLIVFVVIGFVALSIK